jgi:hypothetical protein
VPKASLVKSKARQKVSFLFISASFRDKNTQEFEE